jgi:hypothetical protein
VNAQDAQNPWHLVAYENGEEAAFYNTGVVTGIKTTTQSVIVMLEGKEFSHPITATFGFDPRQAGTGTANENIVAPKWSVHYANGSLNFSEAVNNVSVYSITGALVYRNAGNYTSVPVNLSSGAYIIQAGNNSAKLLISQSGYGGTVAQPKVEAQAATYAYTADSPIELRSSSNGLKTYWNISTNGSTIPVEMSDVESFSFKSDNSIVFTLKNGNTIELAEYKGVEFSTAPAASTNSNWDLTLTFAIGGAVYGSNLELPPGMKDKVELITVLSKTEIIQYNVSLDKETRYPRNTVLPGLLSKGGRLSHVTSTSTHLYPAISYHIVDEWGLERIYCENLYTPHVYLSTPVRYLEFNNFTNLLNSSFVIDNDSLVVSYKNADGKTITKKFAK